ncbi:MAG TPA: Hsp20 family protein [Devosiaceae bacterium]
MSRISLFSAPFLLGFDDLEERLDRMAKGTDGYPPYNIERRSGEDGAERYVISIAVAGFGAADLDVSVEDSQLLVRGRQNDEPGREFLHRGIAARQFQRNFLLAEAMQVEGAELRDGLLIISVLRPQPQKVSRRIEIKSE